MFARRPVPTETHLQSLRARAMLATELAAEAERDLAEAEAEAERLDLIESGDLDADGEPIGYDRCHGGV